MLNALNFALREFGMPKKLVINGYTEPSEEIEEKPQTFDIDIFPRPAMVLEFSKNINKEVEVYVQLDNRKYRLYDTRFYKTTQEVESG